MLTQHEEQNDKSSMKKSLPILLYHINPKIIQAFNKTWGSYL
jgi:hypothetical protein